MHALGLGPWSRWMGRFASQWAWVLALCVVLMAPFAVAATVPQLTGPVVDAAGVLSPATRQALEQQLRAYKQQTGAQVQVYVAKSLEGEPIADVAYQVARKWQLGDAERDDGVLLLVAPREREVRIETGRGVGDRLTDVQASRVIDRQMAPHLARGDYDAGVRQGVQGILASLGDAQAQAAQQAQPNAADDAPTAAEGMTFLLVVVGLGVLWIVLAAGGGGRGGGGGPTDVIGSMLLGALLGGGGGSSWTGRGGGGGWSGGGGGFGGGGASGRY